MNKLVQILVVVTLFAVVISLSCRSDPSKAIRALTAAGYTSIHTTGYRWVGCSKYQPNTTGFTAVGPTGISTSGVVCSSWFPGTASSIQID